MDGVSFFFIPYEMQDNIIIADQQKYCNPKTMTTTMGSIT